MLFSCVLLCAVYHWKWWNSGEDISYLLFERGYKMGKIRHNKDPCIVKKRKLYGAFFMLCFVCSPLSAPRLHRDITRMFRYCIHNVYFFACWCDCFWSDAIFGLVRFFFWTLNQNKPASFFYWLKMSNFCLILSSQWTEFADQRL